MPTDAENEAFREKLRSLNFGKVPGGNRSSKVVVRPKPDPAWERGILTEKRPGGAEMPILDPKDDWKPIRLKQAGERRHEIEAGRDRMRNDPNVHKE